MSNMKEIWEYKNLKQKYSIIINGLEFVVTHSLSNLQTYFVSIIWVLLLQVRYYKNSKTAGTNLIPTLPMFDVWVTKKN